MELAMRLLSQTAEQEAHFLPLKSIAWLRSTRKMIDPENDGIRTKTPWSQG
jgi:hypothetical protein